MGKKEEKKISEEAASVISLLTKANSNPNDAAFEKKEVQLYKKLDSSVISELVDLKYQVNSFKATEEIKTPVDGVYHVVSWK